MKGGRLQGRDGDRGFFHFTRDYWILIFSLFLVNVFFSGLEQFYPLYLSILGADPMGIGVVFTSSVLLMTIFSPLGGYAGDMFGRRKMLIIGPILGFIGLLLLWASPNWILAFPAIIISQIPGAFVGPAFQAYVADITPRERLGKAYGILSSMFNLCFVIGPGTVGFLLTLIGYRSSILLVALATITAGISRFFIKETPRREAALTLRDIYNRISIPFRSREIRPITGAQRGYMLALILRWTYLPLFLKEIIGFQEEMIGILFSIASMAGVLLSPIAGHLADRYKKGLLPLALLVEAASMILLMNFTNFYQLCIAIAMLNGASAFYWPVMDPLLARLIDPDSRGAAFGAIESVRYIGSLPGPLLGGILWRMISPVAPFYTYAILLIGVSIFVYKSFPKPGNRALEHTDTDMG